MKILISIISSPFAHNYLYKILINEKEILSKEKEICMSNLKKIHVFLILENKYFRIILHFKLTNFK